MSEDSKSEDYYQQLARQRIEEMLGWGSSDSWSHNDFVEASEKISSVSGVSLSVTTIKRLMGKIKYEGAATTNTLNAIAVYLGFENWRSFKLSHTSGARGNQSAQEAKAINTYSVETESVVVLKRNFFKRRSTAFLFFFAVLIVVITYSIYYIIQSKSEERAFEKVLFNSEPVTKGLPNTVVFNYDISDCDFDSAFIQQSWDLTKRQRITKENKQSTSIYYLPGHFHAKLILNDKVIKEHGLLIPTDGWLGVVQRSSGILYVEKGELFSQGAMHTEGKKTDSDEEFKTSYYNSHDYGIDADNFTLEASIKNNLKEGGQTCQESYIYIDGEDGVIWIPFSALGCVSNINLNFGDVFISGKDKNLSVFGTDLSKWNNIKCKIVNKKAQIFLNNKLIYSLTYEASVGRIMGINFDFHGAGSVDFVRMSDSGGKIVFEDEMLGY